MTFHLRTMPSHIYRLGAVACLFLALLGGQAFAQGKASEPTPAEQEINNSKLNGEWMLMILLGEMKAGQGDSGGGYSLMLEAARKSGDEQLYKRAVEIALAARSGQPALGAAKEWKKAHPKSQEANRYVLQIHVALNQLPDSMLPLRADIVLTPEAEQNKVIDEIPQLYAQVQDKELAIAVVEQALVPFTDKPATAAASWTTIGRMRLAAKKIPGALDAVKQAMARDPKALEPGMLALELFTQGVNEAEAILIKLLATSEIAAPLRISYARVLIDNQRNTDANTQLEWVIKNAPAFSEAWLLQAAMLIDNNKDEEAQKGLMRFIELEKNKEGARGLSQAYLMLSQIALRQKKTAESEDWLNKIDDPASLVQVQVQRASLMASRGNLAKALELIRQLPNNTPQAGRVRLQAEVKLLRDNKKYEQAYQVLLAAAKESPDDLDLRYEVAMMAEKINRLDEMEKLLRSVIEAKPDFQHAYNALGFALADRNIRLKEARELIVTALEFSPDDPMITDSLGWVEFRMGNKLAALAILQRAYEAKNDPEIGAHLGEVHWSLGQRDKALKLWRDAKRMAPDNEILLDTLKRLKVKL
ncbi:MAG: hypothetical protein EBT70_15235 [Betaproteobacteria bacterium]|nr:hypothetical protein [Betaproteobacteria bacterium]